MNEELVNTVDLYAKFLVKYFEKRGEKFYVGLNNSSLRVPSILAKQEKFLQTLCGKTGEIVKAKRLLEENVKILSSQLASHSNGYQVKRLKRNVKKEIPRDICKHISINNLKI